MKKCSNVKRGSRWLSAVLGGTALGLAIAGCGSSSPAKGPTPFNSQVNNYVGTENASRDFGALRGGVWSVTLDNVTNYFSYANIDANSYTLAPYSPSGTTAAATGGILDLTLFKGAAGSGGYAVNLPKEGLLLRAGDSTTHVIAAATSNVCPAFTSQQTYNFISLGTTYSGDPTPHVAYGSLQVAPGRAGTWTFSNLKMYTLKGDSLSPTQFPVGTCVATIEGSVIVVPLPQTLGMPTPPSVPTQVTVGISQSGLLIVDQGQNTALAATGAPGPTGPMGLVGAIQPAAALNVTDITGKTYAGLESDPLSPLGTVAVVFGATPGTGTAITGGGFPNDDATQQPLTDTTFDLGSQSTQTPGLFPSVTLTRPDSYGLCAGTPAGGTNAKGNPACVFHGAAVAGQVAGQVAGKYVIFANISDPTATANGTATPLAALNLLLYQQ